MFMANNGLPPRETRHPQGCFGDVCEGELNDRLSQLPIDVLLLIMSSFTMKEAATISRVSRLWKKHICGVFPRLNLRDSMVMKRFLHDSGLLHDERSKFVARVNKVVEQHNGPNLEEFIVTFELDNSCESDINKWVLFALQKGVKRLELDFDRASACRVGYAEENRYTLTIDCGMPQNLTHTLTFLRLSRINISSPVVECLLRSCTLLEGLSIQESKVLTTLKVVGSSVPLNRLEVSSCCNLKQIDISAPKLLSFIYSGEPLQLRIANAFALTEVSVFGLRNTPTTYALKSLSEYLSQLESLSLYVCLYVELRLEIRVLPLTNLKYLELIVLGSDERTLEGWFRLIEASPALQSLTLKVIPTLYYTCYGRIIVKRVKQPFRCLKTLKIVGLMGSYVDMVLAKYVIENATELDQVIVYVSQRVKTEKKGDVHARIKELVRLSPSQAKLTFEEPMEKSPY